MVIPNGWEIRKVESITNSVVAGGTPSTKQSTYWNGNIPWMNSGELNKKRVYSVGGRITDLGLNNSSTSIVPPECVLIGLAGQGKTRGTVAVNYFPLCTNQSIAAIFPNPKEYDTEFLYQNLDMRYDELRELSTGDGGRGGLNLKLIRNLDVLFPPLPEQRAIAAALADADGYIAALKRLIAKKRDIKQSAMQKLLHPKVGWDEKTLGEIGYICMCKRIMQYETSTDGDVPFYKIGTFGGQPDAFISYLKYSEYRNKYSFPQVGDVLISAAGTIGRTVVYNGEPAYYQDSNIVWLSVDKTKVLNEYLYYYYQTFPWNVTEGSTIARLYNGIISSTIIYLPTLIEQTQIATFLSDMDAEIDALTAKLNKAKLIKKGMMEQLLTGKIRLEAESNA